MGCWRSRGEGRAGQSRAEQGRGRKELFSQPRSQLSPPYWCDKKRCFSFLAKGILSLSPFCIRTNPFSSLLPHSLLSAVTTCSPKHPYTDFDETNKASKQGQQPDNDDWNKKYQHHEGNTAWVSKVNGVSDADTLGDKHSVILQSTAPPKNDTSEFT